MGAYTKGGQFRLDEGINYNGGENGPDDEKVIVCLQPAPEIFWIFFSNLRFGVSIFWIV